MQCGAGGRILLNCIVNTIGAQFCALWFNAHLSMQPSPKRMLFARPPTNIRKSIFNYMAIYYNLQYNYVRTAIVLRFVKKKKIQ